MQPKTSRCAAASPHRPAARAPAAPASVPRPTPRSGRTGVAQNGSSTAPSSTVRAAAPGSAPAARATAKLSQAPQPPIKSVSPRPLAPTAATGSARRTLPPPPVPLPRVARAMPSVVPQRRTPPPLPVNELTLLTEYDLIDDEVDAPARVPATQHEMPGQAAAQTPARPPQPTKIDDDVQIGCFSRTEPPPWPRTEHRGALLATLAGLTLVAATALLCYRSAVSGGRSTPPASAVAAAVPAGNTAAWPPATTLTAAKTELTHGAGAANASPIAASSKAPQKGAATKRAKTGAGKAKPHPKPHQHQALADDALKL